MHKIYVLFALAVMVLLMPRWGSAHGVGLHAPEEGGTAAYEEAVEARSDEEARRKIESLSKEIERLREEAERPGLTEIIGGIGWIMGILGIAAYIKSRRK